jgi:ankyrin repeat protein
MSEEFFVAVREGKLDRVIRMLEFDVDLVHEKDERGVSPVLLACYHGHHEVAEALVARKVLLTIFEAVATGRLTQIIRLLAREPDLITAYSADGFQPLGLAAFFGQLEVADYLIRAGAPINAASKNEMKAMPLHSAVAGDHFQIVSLLLENGADPNVIQNHKLTPLHLAAYNGNVPMIQLLLFNGADLSVTDDEGRKPLDIAVDRGFTSAVQLLKAGVTKRFRKQQQQPKE